MRRLFLLLAICLGLNVSPTFAQKLSLSTNMLDYICLGTFNAETSYSVGQHWSLIAGARYNPFTFHRGDADRQFQYRQQSYALGARFWLWHTFSGWWITSKVRYQEYNHGGVISRIAEEGDRVGLSLSAGYTYMLSRHWNLEFGIGTWGGKSWYRRYSCPVCGITMDSGRKWFLLPDDMTISVAYVF